jgi:acetyltransferase EpsM
MKRIVILGGSGIGMIAASIANELGFYEVLGFFNDVLPIGTQIGKYNKIPVIGTSNDVAQYLKKDNVYFFIAYVGMQNEQKVFEKIESLSIPRERLATLIHPSVIIPKGFCEIGYGVLMAPLSQLSPDSTIEDNCILLPNSFVGHDSTLRKFAHIATNAVVGANVDIGKAVHVGSNATIREKIKVGDYALIGSGSVVLSDIGENEIWVGNPAKLLRSKENN